jgi:hypothetical protein
MKDFKVDITHVIEGNISSVTSNTLISPSEVDKFLKSEGLKKVDFDSNGLDWDFWATYEKDGVQYTLAGSVWYNEGLTFSRDY